MNVEQGTFLPLVILPTVFQAGLWSTWLTVLCSLKVLETFFVMIDMVFKVTHNIKLIAMYVLTCQIQPVQMFQALARDRLERLNASPSATPWTYFRVFSVLLLVLTVDLFWYCLLLLFIVPYFWVLHLKL